MNPRQYIILALYVVETLYTIGMIGRERPPFTPSSGVAAVILNGILAYLVITICQ